MNPNLARPCPAGGRPAIGIAEPGRADIGTGNMCGTGAVA